MAAKLYVTSAGFARCDELDLAPIGEGAAFTAEAEAIAFPAEAEANAFHDDEADCGVHGYAGTGGAVLIARGASTCPLAEDVPGSLLRYAGSGESSRG